MPSPKRVVSQLRRIVTNLEKSSSPDRGLVAKDIKRVVSGLTRTANANLFVSTVTFPDGYEFDPDQGDLDEVAGILKGSPFEFDEFETEASGMVVVKITDQDMLIQLSREGHFSFKLNGGYKIDVTHSLDDYYDNIYL